MKTNTVKSNSTLLFRPDIEGLRGLAVLFVMLLHFNTPFITGGYIGVDVFFVLSGFLITAMIVYGTQNHRFSFKNFYNRRIKRLAPASLFVVTLTVVTFSFFLLPDDFTSFMRSAREVFLFKSNVYFAKEIKDYFGAEAEAMPLLHTWSLAVEWQFYFIFPVVLFTILKFFKKPLLILSACLFGSLAYSVYASYNIETAYFATSARAFEFLMGACVVFINISNIKKYSTWFTTLSLLSLLGMALYYDASSAYPGINAFGVSLATSTILIFGANNKLLTSRAMTTLGRLSYSAYLWHWPIAVAMYHFGYVTNGYLLLPLIALTFLLSQLTYSLIENPLRRSKLSLKESIIYLVVIPIIVIMIVFSVVRKHDGLPQRLGPEQARASSIIRAHEDLIRKKCHAFQGEDIEQCSFGEQLAPSGTALFIGDSHAAHYRSFVDVIISDVKLKAYVQTDSACLMLLGEYEATNKNLDATCLDKTIEMYQFIAQENLDYVIISLRWLGYTTHQYSLAINQDRMTPYIDALSESIEFIVDSGAKPVLLLPIAEGSGENLNLCFYRHINNPTVCDINKNETDKKLKDIYRIMGIIKKSYPDIILINPQSVQCEDESCMTSYDGIPLYEDTHHINDYGATFFAEKYLSQHGNPLSGFH